MITINVTEEHIKRGLPRKSHMCPIAHALWSATKVNYTVGFVQVMRLQSAAAPLGPTILLPRAAAEFIETFDREEPVQPFSFELDI